LISKISYPNDVSYSPSNVKMKVGTPNQHGKSGGKRIAVGGSTRRTIGKTIMEIKTHPTYTI
jgi:hypothetical protein